MPEPKINDQYWLDLATTFIGKGSIDRIDSGIKSLNTFTSGLLAVYTASAIFTIEYKDISKPIDFLVFGIPYVVILFARWYANKSVLPKKIEFDYRSPTDIENAYSEIFNYRYGKLKMAVAISLIATLLVAFTLLYGFYLGNQIKEIKQLETQQKENQKKPHYNLEYLKAESTILVSGYFPPKEKVKMKYSKLTKSDTTLYPAKHFKINDYGVFYNSIKIDGCKSCEYEFYIQWNSTNSDEKNAKIKTIKIK